MQERINYFDKITSTYEKYEKIGVILGDSMNEDLGLFAVRYNLSMVQSLGLACLATVYPSSIELSQWLEDVYHYCSQDYYFLDYRDLLDRGFITCSESAFSLSCNAFNAFSIGCDLQTAAQPDIIDILRNASYNFSQKWMDCLQSQEVLNEPMQNLGVVNMSTNEQQAFWTLVIHFVKNFTAPLAFSGNAICLDSEYKSESYLIKQGCANLVKLGLAVSLPIEPMEDTHETDRYVIAPKVVEQLFHGKEELVSYDSISHQTDVILSKDIVQKDLFFSEQVQEQIDNLKQVLSKEGFARAQAILKRQKRNPAVQSLLWGPPGTGKTEVVKQIARETGRDIIIFDSAKVTASAWGATEKNYRNLFLVYGYIASVSENVPILLLNEADSVLSKRLSIFERSIDRSENNISNILLQAFEDMRGILLATTNYASNMDKAFDRRFLFKTHLDNPDAAARKCIWKSLIPQLNDSEATTLATDYEMSGAQISNVVAKRDLAELYYAGDRGLDYIIDLCEIELQEPIKGTGRKVGF